MSTNQKQLSLRSPANPGIIILPEVSTFSIELVLNSLDAAATDISIEIDSKSHNITVTDNGFGMNFMELEKIGNCGFGGLKGVSERRYGYWGKSLPLIIRCSRSVKVQTRKKDSEYCYSKLIEYGKDSHFGMELGSNFPKGTSITVYGALDNRVVKQHFDREKVLDELKTKLGSLKWKHPGLKLSVTWDTELCYVWDPNSSLCEFLEKRCKSRTKISVETTDTVKSGPVSMFVTVISTCSNVEVLPSKIFVNNREVASSEVTALFNRAVDAFNNDLNCGHRGYVLNVYMPPELATITIGPICNKMKMHNPEILTEGFLKIASFFSSMNQLGVSQKEFIQSNQTSCNFQNIDHSGTLTPLEIEIQSSLTGYPAQVRGQEKFAGSYPITRLASAYTGIANNDASYHGRGIVYESGSRSRFSLSHLERNHLEHKVNHPSLTGNVTRDEVVVIRRNKIPATTAQYENIGGSDVRTPKNRMIQHLYTPSYYSKKNERLGVSKTLGVKTIGIDQRIVSKRKANPVMTAGRNLNTDAGDAARTPKNRMIQHMYTPNYYNKGQITQNSMKRQLDDQVQYRKETPASKKTKMFQEKYSVLKIQDKHSRAEMKQHVSSTHKPWTPGFKNYRLRYADQSTQTIHSKNCKCSCW